LAEGGQDCTRLAKVAVRGVMRPLPAVELCHAPNGMEVLVYRSQRQDKRKYTRYVVSLSAQVPNVRTGELEYFGKVDLHYVHRKNKVKRKKVARWVRALVHAWLCHEADEWIHVDGVRVFDPHKTRSK